MSEIEQTKRRHGFVTFWLWLGIIVNIITIFTAIIAYQNFTNLGYVGMDLIASGVDINPFCDAINHHVFIMQIIAGASGVCLIAGYVLLLKWKKAGFWLLAITSVIVAGLNVLMMNFVKQDYALLGLNINWSPITQLIVTPISVLILWGILQIKKDGISCWKLLQ